MKNLHANLFNTCLIAFIAAVWFINGLYCKVLNLVPRHEDIVSSILGSSHSRTWTIIIGISEVIMAIWVLTRYKPKLNTYTQILVVLAMNIVEFILTPDLLLWGRMNLVFAILFVGLVYLNGFILSKNPASQSR